jgi:hypothetical protein
MHGSSGFRSDVTRRAPWRVLVAVVVTGIAAGCSGSAEEDARCTTAGAKAASAPSADLSPRSAGLRRDSGPRPVALETRVEHDVDAHAARAAPSVAGTETLAIT